MKQDKPSGGTQSSSASYHYGAAKELVEILEPYHSYSCQSRQAWVKGMTEPFPCNCSILEALAQLQHLIEQREADLEKKLDKLYTEIEKSLPPQTFNRSEQQWNDGFYKGQLKALELVSMKLFNKSGDALSTDTDGLASDKPTVRKDTEHGRGKS